MNTELILQDTEVLPRFALAPVAHQMRENALEASALIGTVQNADQNQKCVAAKKGLKGLISLVEAERKQLKEPILNAGRELDKAAKTFVDECEREFGRLEELEREFIRAELRRQNEEQELQRKRLAAIEAERLAALAKAQTPAEVQRITETADARAYVESQPVELTRAPGQAVRRVWIIDRINDFQLMKARPDLVRRIEWDMLGIKEALRAGTKLPGVTAREDIDVDTRGVRPAKVVSV